MPPCPGERMDAETTQRWEEVLVIEKIAQQYEYRLRVEGTAASIEAILAAHPSLPETALLRALVETELDALGEDSCPLGQYQTRFPQHADWLPELYVGPSSAGEMPLRTGEMVDQYRVQRFLGRGGSGIVFLARDLRLNQPVALKLLRPDWRTECGPGAADRFRDESRSVRSLRHPSIVRLLDCGEWRGLPYQILAYIPGVTLREFANRRSLGPVVAANLVARIAAAIHFSHRHGLVHRDLKPSNILVRSDGRPFVTDFGVALKYQDVGRTQGFAGTLRYASPEQASGRSDLVDGRADVFALGIILYELATGAHPFGSHYESSEALSRRAAPFPAIPLRQRSEVPRWFERICLKALQTNPRDRYATAADLATDLRHFAFWQQWRLPAAAVLLVAMLALLATSVNRLPKAKVAANHSVPATAPPKAPDPTPGNVPNKTPVERPVEPPPPELEETIRELLDTASPGESTWSRFSAAADNTLQTALIHACAPRQVDWRKLQGRIRQEPKSGIRAALLLTLGEYSIESLPQEARQAFVPELVRWFREDPDSGVHAACEWLMWQWGFPHELAEARLSLQSTLPGPDRNWFEILPGLTMVVCRRPGAEPAAETGLVASSVPFPGDLDFCVSSRELTTHEVAWLTSSRRPDNANRLGDEPIGGLTWHRAAELCNRLSMRMGLPTAEFAYEPYTLPDGRSGYRPVPNCRGKRGVRMPTAEEWSYVSRAGSQTPRYWGSSESLAPKYAICRVAKNSTPLPVGSLKPNPLGFFDTLGNVSEWTFAEPQPSPTSATASDIEYPIRGGSAWSPLTRLAVDESFPTRATEDDSRLGLRVACSLIPTLPEDPMIEFVWRNGDAAPRVLAPNEVIPLGVIQRGDKVRRQLEVRNQSAKRVTIEQFERTLFLDGPMESATIEPGGSHTWDITLDTVVASWRDGILSCYFRIGDEEVRLRNTFFGAYITGPGLEVHGIHVRHDGTGFLDFGKVPQNSRVRQRIFVNNGGDSPLEITSNGASGSVRAIQDFGPQRLFPTNLAYLHLEFDTTLLGTREGNLTFRTNDREFPQVTLTLRATVEPPDKLVTFGVYRRGTWLWDQDRDGVPDRSIPFGEADDIPLTGDFNGDGQVDLAVVHPDVDQRMRWRLRQVQPDGGTQVREVTFGDSRSSVCTGDFDGNGRWDLCAAQAAPEGIWVWQYDLNQDGIADEELHFDRSPAIPVAADWNGDGRSDQGVFFSDREPGTARGSIWRFRTTPLRQATFGEVGDIPVTGDWDGDGFINLGVFRIKNGQGYFLLDLNDLNHNANPESEVQLGLPGDLPVIGRGIMR